MALATGIPHSSSNPVTPLDSPCANLDQPLREVSVVSSLVEAGIIVYPWSTSVYPIYSHV